MNSPFYGEIFRAINFPGFLVNPLEVIECRIVEGCLDSMDRTPL